MFSEFEKIAYCVLTAGIWISIVFYKCESMHRGIRLFVVFILLNISFSSIYYLNPAIVPLILAGISALIEYVFFDHVMRASLGTKKEIIEKFRLDSDDMPKWLFIFMQIIALFFVAHSFF